ncbi:hypothetical protein BH09VER1_BH09VER1_41130 [soil metagenome]
MRSLLRSSCLKKAVSLCLLLLASAPLPAAAPGWWVSGSTQFIERNGTPDNYAPANLGQLKNVAKQARAHLNYNLPEGAGDAIDALIASFEPRRGQKYSREQLARLMEDNYAPVNLGQLKAVAKPFYDRLLANHYDSRANLIDHGYPRDWAFDYPWNPKTPRADNYVPVNLGQLKMVFSFDVTSFDGDCNGIPDAWEYDLGWY